MIRQGAHQPRAPILQGDRSCTVSKLQAIAEVFRKSFSKEGMSEWVLKDAQESYLGQEDGVIHSMFTGLS